MTICGRWVPRSIHWLHHSRDYNPPRQNTTHPHFTPSCKIELIGYAYFISMFRLMWISTQYTVFIHINIKLSKPRINTLKATQFFFQRMQSHNSFIPKCTWLDSIAYTCCKLVSSPLAFEPESCVWFTLGGCISCYDDQELGREGHVPQACKPHPVLEDPLYSHEQQRCSFVLGHLVGVVSLSNPTYVFLHGYYIKNILLLVCVALYKINCHISNSWKHLLKTQFIPCMLTDCTYQPFRHLAHHN